MRKERPKVQMVIESAFLASIDRLTKECGTAGSRSLLVQLDQEAGELQLYDERQQLLGKKVIFEWANMRLKDRAARKKAVQLVKSALQRIAGDRRFDTPTLSKPFVFRLTDEEFSPLEDLCVIKEHAQPADDHPWGSFERVLDDFYADLFSDLQ